MTRGLIVNGLHVQSSVFTRCTIGLNESKNAHIGDRQRDMAKKFYQAGLLSKKGLETVLQRK